MTPCSHRYPDGRACATPTERTLCDQHERQRQRVRNAKPERKRLYDAEWTRHSRQRRTEHPSCMEADATCKGVLSVDHPTDDVLCMSHHDRREARRRSRVG